MRVKVLYFARLRELVGTREQSLDIPAGTTIADLKKRLQAQHGALVSALDVALSSINREFASPEETLNEGDEVAFFPPVSGGREAKITLFRLTEEPLDLNALLAELVQPDIGAACVFTGIVRGRTERGGPRETAHLEYEAYTPMAEAKMRQVAEEMRSRWPQVEGIAIVQRLGHLDPGTPSVLIACTAAHRDSGVFEAARYGIDRLKEIIPIWKKEVGPTGDAWVEGDYFPGQKDKA